MFYENYVYTKECVYYTAVQKYNLKNCLESTFPFRINIFSNLSDIHANKSEQVKALYIKAYRESKIVVCEHSLVTTKNHCSNPDRAGQ